ncbi:hypothetical protein, partial [Arthrobacter sp. 9AX]|uniref:hypothetical protein n=1 Tax=Arthrobacter sp. 9AX TaxID=2653131 RepID=UPI001915EBE8
MGKNTKNRRANKGSGKGRPAPVSLSSFRASRALDAAAPAYIQWFDDGRPGAGAAALQYLKFMEPVMGRYLESSAAPDLTNLDPAALANAVAEEVAEQLAGPAEAPDEADTDEIAYTVDAVRSYVEFLSETGRWTGTAEQLAEVLDAFDDLAGAATVQEPLEVPDIPEDQALVVFSALPLIQKTTALLRWIGDGKPVTGTGAVRLSDIAEAAACVGVQAKGSTRKAEPAGDVTTVRSMHEVPLLSRIWAALAAAELIHIKPTKVVPSEEARNFLSGDPSPQLEEFRTFTAMYLDQAVLRLDPDQPWERTIAAVQVSVLLSAATPEAPVVERILAAPEHAPEAEKNMAQLLTKVAMGRFEELAELGLLTIDTHFRVPPALIQCVADAFDDPWLLAELGLGEAPDEEAPGDEAPVAGETAGNILE